jgi:hypothetical protein
LRLSPAKLRGIVPALILLLSVMVTGCSTMKDPVVGSERLHAAPVPLRNVLVVVDYRLEVRATGASGRRAEAQDAMYAPIGQMMGEMVTAAGGKPTIVHVRHEDELPRVSADYSHVWTQRVTRLVAVTRDGITAGDQREWRGSLAHRASAGAALANAYEVDYKSDAVACWTILVYANKEDCKVKQRALIGSQLQKYLGPR